MSTPSSAVVRTEERQDRAAVAAVIEQAFEADAPGEGPRARDLEQALHAGSAPADQLGLVAGDQAGFTAPSERIPPRRRSRC